jgi:hypothetical protein
MNNASSTNFPPSTIILLTPADGIIKQNDDSAYIIIYSFVLSIFLTPLASISTLLCVSKPLSRAIIIRSSGFSGILWTGLFFFLMRDWQSPSGSTWSPVPNSVYSNEGPNNYSSYNSTSEPLNPLIAPEAPSVALSSVIYYETPEDSYVQTRMVAFLSLAILTLLTSVLLIFIGCTRIKMIRESADIDTLHQGLEAAIRGVPVPHDRIYLSF